jgi:hypothetical protein
VASNRYRHRPTGRRRDTEYTRPSSTAAPEPLIPKRPSPTMTSWIRVGAQPCASV